MKIVTWLFALGLFLLVSCKSNDKKKEESTMEAGNNWPSYGGNKAGNRYSPLTQINAGNVKDLQVVWIYDAREPVDSSNLQQRPKEIQCQPIVVDGILYGTTPELKLFAVNAATGKELWKFTPLKHNQRFSTNRGVMYWQDGDDKRILYSSGSTLYAVNAVSGKPVTSFGVDGKVKTKMRKGELNVP